MGLLDKAKGSQVKINPDLNVLFSQLDSFESGIDFSIHLFRKLTEYLDIEKAALFLISENPNSFDCLLSKGYDKTTSNRLRLNENSHDSVEFLFFGNEKKSYHSVEPPPFLKDVMSSREYGLLDEIFWIPFIVSDGLFALIMISQWNSVFPDFWNDLFDSISSRYSLKIFNSRKSLLKQSPNTAARSYKTDLPDFIDKYRGRNTLILKIDLNPLIQLLSTSDGMSHINIKKEIQNVFRTMAGSYQEIFELSNNQLLLMLDRDRTADKDLFIHQISASLPLLFQDLKNPPQIDYLSYENPGDDESRDALISEFI